MGSVFLETQECFDAAGSSLDVKEEPNEDPLTGSIQETPVQFERMCRVCGIPKRVVFCLSDIPEVICCLSEFLSLNIDPKFDEMNGYPGVVCKMCCNLVEMLQQFNEEIKAGQDKLKKKMQIQEPKRSNERQVLQEPIPITTVITDMNMKLETGPQVELMEHEDRLEGLRVAIISDRTRPQKRKTCGDTSCVACNKRRCGVCHGCKNKKGCDERKCPKRNLKSVMKTYRPPKCKRCFQTFKHASSLSKHKKVCVKAHNNYIYECCTCKHKCLNIIDWRQHVQEQSHEYFLYRCTKCTKLFDKVSSVNSHHNRKHREGNLKENEEIPLGSESGNLPDDNELQSEAPE